MYNLTWVFISPSYCKMSWLWKYSLSRGCKLHFIKLLKQKNKRC